MNIKEFIEVYKEHKKPRKLISVREFIKKSNHEIWRNCPKCGEFWDARADGLKCPKCGDDGTI